jgi:ABC-type branched-subunit amino acid transport system substrate-binding protein
VRSYLQKIFFLMVLNLAVLLAVPCSAELPVIKIGALYGLTGPVAAMSQEYQRGALIAKDYLAQRKIANLEIIFEDTNWQTAHSISAYRMLYNNMGVRIFHVLGSPATLAIKPLSEADGSVLLAAAAHPQILSNSKLILQHANLADNDAAVVYASVRKSGATNVGLVSMNNEWSASFAGIFAEKAITDSLVKVDAHEHLPQEHDFKSLLLRVLSKKPECLVINSFGLAAGEIIIQARRLGFEGPIFANIGLYISPDAMSLLRKTNEKNLQYQTYLEPPKAFVDLYSQRHGVQPDSLAYMAFFDFELLAQIFTRNPDSSREFAISEIKKESKLRGAFRTHQISSEGLVLASTEMRTWGED